MTKGVVIANNIMSLGTIFEMKKFYKTNDTLYMMQNMIYIIVCHSNSSHLIFTKI